MPQPRKILPSSQKQKKVSVSPIHILLGVFSIGIFFLVINLNALRKAVENNSNPVVATAVVDAGNSNRNAQPVLSSKTTATKMIVNNDQDVRNTLQKEDVATRKGDSNSDTTTTTTTDTTTGTVQYQIIFSTGCSAFQDWQSYIFFFHAAKALKNAAPPLSAMENTHVTRIASGCSDEDAEAMQKIHKEQIEIMTTPERNNFHLHVTPDFSKVHGEKSSYKYFNKPYGTKHWLENALGYSKDAQGENPYDNHIVILMDPDQIILRPFTNDFSKNPEAWRTRTSLPYWDKITHGQPFSQQYGFHNQWYSKTNISQVAKPEELPSPLESMSRSMINENFAAGPPYMATGRDFYRIADKWAEFVVPVWKQYPFLLGEMFAFCLASAHLNLPQQIVQSFMISDTGTGGMEGWKSIDKYSEKDMCTKGAIPQERLPNVLHYCQRYWLGKWFIGKYKLPKDFISCQSPLLQVPPDDIALKYDFAIQPGSGEVKKLNQQLVKRNAYVLCTFIPALNEAARFYKGHHCANDPPNTKETLIFHSTLEITKAELGK